MSFIRDGAPISLFVLLGLVGVALGLSVQVFGADLALSQGTQATTIMLTFSAGVMAVLFAVLWLVSARKRIHEA